MLGEFFKEIIKCKSASSLNETYSHRTSIKEKSESQNDNLKCWKRTQKTMSLKWKDTIVAKKEWSLIDGKHRKRSDDRHLRHSTVS